LLNRMVGEERSIVSPTPGTTMDTVDTEVTREGHLYRFVDTAGIRRKGKTNLVAEKLSVVMARRGLERADVALLVVDDERKSEQRGSGEAPRGSSGVDGAERRTRQRQIAFRV
jgi:predicted GTPase